MAMDKYYGRYIEEAIKNIAERKANHMAMDKYYGCQSYH
jgi:hypothetical protein